MKDNVLDISHFNGDHLDFAQAKVAGIEAIFHKATQGTRYCDPRLIINRQKILDVGLLFGCYHFGTGSATGTDQADYFLKSVPQGALLALDFEPNPQGAIMTLRQAQDFCAAIESATKRAIVIYTGAPMMPQALQLKKGAFGDRPLWFAQYSSSPSRAPKDWPLTLWQHTEHGYVDGIGHCDRNQFYGDDLKSFWNGAPFAGVSGSAEGAQT